MFATLCGDSWGGQSEEGCVPPPHLIHFSVSGGGPIPALPGGLRRNVVFPVQCPLYVSCQLY